MNVSVNDYQPINLDDIIEYLLEIKSISGDKEITLFCCCDDNGNSLRVTGLVYDGDEIRLCHIPDAEMASMNDRKTRRLKSLAIAMRRVAGPIGPLHSWWDIISDLEVMSGDGRISRIGMDAKQLIAYAEERLLKHYGERR